MQKPPVRLAIIGLTHTHVHWVFNSAKQGDIEIVAIVEPNRELAQRYLSEYDYAMNIVFDTMEEMIQATKPECVSAFGTIYEHLEVVEKAAPHGIHVMVEKPLAVSLEHAKKMEALAKQHNIHLLTNYETTWYPTTHKARELLTQGNIGQMRKVIVRDGHRGPMNLGLNKEFTDWLIDPKQNGGGAMTDFGCYGINIMTWLMSGERPLSVTAVTQQLQADKNPQVEDDSTIILKYKNANAIIQGSWSWPIGRKDMEIYGSTGVLYADNRHELRQRTAEGYDGFHETKFNLEELAHPYNDAFSLFAAVVRGEVELQPYDLSSLENNMVVMEVLDLAVKSVKTKTTVKTKVA